MWSSRELICCRDSPSCSPLNAVSQANKTKNMNGMILGTYMERLNLFQKCEMLVADYSD